MTHSNPRWLQYLPASLRNRIEHRPNLQAVLSNTGWLFADKVLRMGVGLFVGVWVARYLGPEQFGLWNFAIAFVSLFGAFATLGLDSIVVRELVKNPESQNELLGTAFFLKLAGALIALILAIVAISLMRGGDILTLWLVVLSALGFVFQSVNVIDFYFQSKVQSRYTVYASNAAFILMTLVKIVLLTSSAPLIAFAIVGFSEIVLTGVFLLVAYKINHLNISDWSYSNCVAKRLVKFSWPLVFSSLAIAVFMKIDQIMLQYYLGSNAVGIYSAAVRVSEVWYFLGTIVISSVAPAVYQAKKDSKETYVAKLLYIHKVIIFLSFLIIIPFSFLSSIIVSTLYGLQYYQASSVLLVHTWTTLFVFVGLAQGVFWVSENLQKMSLISTIIAASINILMNFILIPRYGVTGAAVATLISYGVPTIFLPYFFKPSRPIFFIFFQSFNIFRFR